MATGDIRNNLKILSAEIRSVKTPAAIVNLDGMMAGEADVYLPVYDYLFQWYNTKLANEILQKDLKLPPYKHSKNKFLETMYLILRELFQWKPPLSTAQFFSAGFAEKKIIMCSNIIKLIKDYSSSLQRGAGRTANSNTSSMRFKSPKQPGKNGSTTQKAATPTSNGTSGKEKRKYIIVTGDNTANTQVDICFAAAPSSRAVLSAKIDSLLHHLMEVQSSVKLLKDQMLLVMNQTESMLDKVLPVVTEIVDELCRREEADAKVENSSTNTEPVEESFLDEAKEEVLLDD